MATDAVDRSGHDGDSQPFGGHCSEAINGPKLTTSKYSGPFLICKGVVQTCAESASRSAAKRSPFATAEGILQVASLQAKQISDPRDHSDLIIPNGLENTPRDKREEADEIGSQVGELPRAQLLALTQSHLSANWNAVVSFQNTRVHRCRRSVDRILGDPCRNGSEAKLGTQLYFPLERRCAVSHLSGHRKVVPSLNREGTAAGSICRLRSRADSLRHSAGERVSRNDIPPNSHLERAEP